MDDLDDGRIEIDGSSTVFPITAAIAEEYSRTFPDSKITISISGTGAGFKKVAAGDIDINNASRPINEEEQAAAHRNGIELHPISVALDGLTVVVNPMNDFVDSLTVDELTAIWEQGSSIKYWDDIRPEWPHERIKLYAPSVDSGTFDYFNETITGGSSRHDVQASSDDNVLVIGVSGDPYALGYFGFAYYEENKDKLRAVPIDGGNGPVTPSTETIQNGAYEPLSRPVYLYVNATSYKAKESIRTFVEYYLDHVSGIAPEVGFVTLPEHVLEEEKIKLQNLMND